MAQRRLYRALLRHTNAEKIIKPCLISPVFFQLPRYASPQIKSLPIVLRTCIQCNQTKALSAFPRNSRVKSGHTAHCKACHIQRTQKWREKDPIQYRLQEMVNSSKQRALKKGLPHTITSEQLLPLVQPYCPYLPHIALNWDLPPASSSQFRHPRFNSPSLERINPSLGYTIDNVIIISHRANCIKNDASEHELATIAQNVASLKMQRIVNCLV